MHLNVRTTRDPRNVFGRVPRALEGRIASGNAGAPSGSTARPGFSRRHAPHSLGRVLLTLLVGLILEVGSVMAAKGQGIRPVRPDDASGTSAAVVVDGALPLVYTTQLFPTDEQGKVIAAGRAEDQASAVLDRLEATLRAAGSGLDRLVRVHVSAASEDTLPAFRAAFSRRISGKAHPAVSFVVGRWPGPKPCSLWMRSQPRCRAHGPGNTSQSCRLERGSSSRARQTQAPTSPRRPARLWRALTRPSSTWASTAKGSSRSRRSSGR